MTEVKILIKLYRQTPVDCITESKSFNEADGQHIKLMYHEANLVVNRINVGFIDTLDDLRTFFVPFVLCNLSELRDLEEAFGFGVCYPCQFHMGISESGERRIWRYSPRAFGGSVSGPWWVLLFHFVQYESSELRWELWVILHLEPKISFVLRFYRI